MARLIAGESARKLCKEYGTTRQAMDQLRERAILIGKKRDLGLDQGKSLLTRLPAIRAALDDKDAACTALAEAALRAFEDEQDARASKQYQLASMSRNSGIGAVNALGSKRGWDVKPTNAAEQQTSDALAALVGGWLSQASIEPVNVTTLQNEGPITPEEEESP